MTKDSEGRFVRFWLAGSEGEAERRSRCTYGGDSVADANLSTGTLLKGLTHALVDVGVRDRNLSREASLEEGEKSCVYMKRRPYRKPTQVVRKKILRPTGEG